MRLQTRIDKYNSSPSRRRPSVESFMQRVPFFAGSSRKNSAQSVMSPAGGSERKGSAPPQPSPNLRSNRTERALMGRYAQHLLSKFSYGGDSVIDPDEKFEGDLEAQKKRLGPDAGALRLERGTHSGAVGGPTTPPRKVHVESTIVETDRDSDTRALRADDSISPLAADDASCTIGRRTSIDVYCSDGNSDKSG